MIRTDSKRAPLPAPDKRAKEYPPAFVAYARTNVRRAEYVRTGNVR